MKKYHPTQPQQTTSSLINNIKRYRPGQVPHFARSSQDSDDEAIAPISGGPPPGSIQISIRQPTSGSTKSQEDQVDRSGKKEEVKVDRRLQRLSEAGESDRVRRRQRKVFDGEVVLVKTQTDDIKNETIVDNRSSKGTEVEEQEEVEDRRARMLKRMAAMNVQEPTAVEVTRESEEEEDSSEDEEEDDDAVLLKPVFVPKNARVSDLEKQRREEEELREIALQQQLAEQRRIESHNLVAEMVRREVIDEKMGQEQAIYSITDVDDTDGLDPDAEFQAWHVRELQRMKRDKETRLAYYKELEETERRRNLTDAERRAEDEKAGIDRFKKEKGQHTFLQKYYHKGAFYQDMEADVLKRDYTAPTLEDRVNKQLLPEIMQVKNFGKAGRTKWTHLAKEDTTQRDAAWTQNNELNKRMQKRMGGMHSQDLDRPSVKKRK